MKKVLFMFMLAALGCMNGWGQVSVVKIGDAVLNKNNFKSAQQVFEENELDIDPLFSSETHAVSMMGTNKFNSVSGHIFAVSQTDQRIKEVWFTIGKYHFDSVEPDLKSLGYTLLKTGTATLGNGHVVPQKTYAKGNKRCMVQTLDKGEALAITFKRQ